MSEQTPEPRPTEPVGNKPPARENVFTRKLGPLPMWAWLALVAVVILLYVVLSSKKKGSGQQGPGKNPQQGYGAALLPSVIINRWHNQPPHVGHHHHRGGHKHKHHGHKPTGPGGVDPGGPMDPAGADEAVAQDADTQKAALDPGPRAHAIPGHNRRHMRGEPIPGELVAFKTAERGSTPSLADVANHYGTEPDAIVMEAEGRGYPSSTAWKRYVARHDWASPLPPATDLSILAHPTG